MANKYQAKQLKQSPDFIEYQDVIMVLFDPEELVTKEEAKARIDEFLNREVM